MLKRTTTRSHKDSGRWFWRAGFQIDEPLLDTADFLDHAGNSLGLHLARRFVSDGGPEAGHSSGDVRAGADFDWFAGTRAREVRVNPVAVARRDEWPGGGGLPPRRHARRAGSAPAADARRCRG